MQLFVKCLGMPGNDEYEVIDPVSDAQVLVYLVEKTTLQRCGREPLLVCGLGGQVFGDDRIGLIIIAAEIEVLCLPYPPVLKGDHLPLPIENRFAVGKKDAEFFVDGRGGCIQPPGFDLGLALHTD